MTEGTHHRSMGVKLPRHADSPARQRNVKRPGFRSSSPPPIHPSAKIAPQFFLGVTLAGVASFLLVTVFGLFSLDVFLVAYHLPLETYKVGSIIFALFNAANDVLGAWYLDSAASRMHRSDLIGVSGCIFCVAFLAPFFRWKGQNEVWDGIHFVLSVSLYDTMYSFTAILLGSLVTDNHFMGDHERVRFMASGKIANLIASLLVARIGLLSFDETNLYAFRVFLLILAVLTAVLFLGAQVLTRYSIGGRWGGRWTLLLQDDSRNSEESLKSAEKKRVHKRLHVGQVLQDFWNHHNFWAWIGMELFLESQVSFANAFLKIFVDRLVFNEGVSRERCDWLLSMVRPLGLIFGILCYLPIQKYGYRRLYPTLFLFNIALCLIMWMTSTHQSTNMIIAFLLIYPTATVAVSSSGFHLAMSDLVLEMKKNHAFDGRLDEPSLAGLFMGMNALFCKPAESILPVVAANVLDHLDLTAQHSGHVQMALFKLLIFPPLVFSVLEWVSWRRYTLTPHKTSQMRTELRRLHDSSRDDYHVI